jgi:hypothetical protein
MERLILGGCGKLTVGGSNYETILELVQTGNTQTKGVKDEPRLCYAGNASEV